MAAPESTEETAPPTRGFAINGRTINAGLAAVGVIALAAAGFVNITTPGQEECEDKLADVRVASVQDISDIKVQLADSKARLELLEIATDTCKDALDSLTQRDP